MTPETQQAIAQMRACTDLVVRQIDCDRIKLERICAALVWLNETHGNVTVPTEHLPAFGEAESVVRLKRGQAPLAGVIKFPKSQ